MASKYNSKYHVYKAVWMPAIGEQLSGQSKDNNKYIYNGHTIAVIKALIIQGENVREANRDFLKFREAILKYRDGASVAQGEQSHSQGRRGELPLWPLPH